MEDEKDFNSTNVVTTDNEADATDVTVAETLFEYIQAADVASCLGLLDREEKNSKRNWNFIFNQCPYYTADGKEIEIDDSNTRFNKPLLIHVVRHELIEIVKAILTNKTYNADVDICLKEYSYPVLFMQLVMQI